MDIFLFCCAIEDIVWNPAEDGWLPLFDIMPELDGTASTPGGSVIPLAGTPPGPVELGAPPTARLLEFELS